MQVRLYILFNLALFSKDSDKVLYTSSYLRGKVARGFRTYLKDQLDNQDLEDIPSGEIKLIFEDYSEFENKLISLYGIANEEANTDREIRKLRQTSSVTIYALDFLGFSADLEWNDATLRLQFYLSLKDVVKGELIRERKAGSLKQLMQVAKEVDEKLHELRQSRGYKTGKVGSYPDASGKSSYRLQPIDLSATRSDRLPRLRKERRCFGCSRTGHIAKNCKQLKEKDSQRNTFTAIIVSYIQARQIDCYNDGYLTHLPDKEGLGWFPSPRDGYGKHL